MNIIKSGISMDGITSTFLMTKSDEIVHESIFISFLSRIKTPVNITNLQERASKYGLHPFSGKTLFSSILPQDYNYFYHDLTICNGILVNGKVNNFHINMIAKNIRKSYGDQIGEDFITDVNCVFYGFHFHCSVGQQFYAGDRPSTILPDSGIFLPREHATDEELRERESCGRFIPTMPIRPTDREAPVQERGYSVHSFSDGFTPSEVFSQACGTRGDLINTNKINTNYVKK